MSGVDADLAGKQALHEAFFLLLESAMLLFEQLDFFIAGLENSSDFLLFVYGW